MGIKSSIGQFLRKKLGVSALGVEIEQRLRYSQAMLQFSLPEIMVPDDQMLELVRSEIGGRYGDVDFNPVIHKNDLMFQHHFRKSPDEPAMALFHYYNVGLAALEGIQKEIGDKTEVRSVLDFGSGYGRGSRFLNHFFPSARVSVSEIKSTALEFQKDQWGFETVSHGKDAASFRSQAVDLIIAISVFSHLPRALFEAWSLVLYDRLLPGGSLFFTYNAMQESDNLEYSFISQSEDEGLDWVEDRIQQSENYGSAFYSDSAMRKILDRAGGTFRIIPFFSGSQHAVVLSKPIMG